MEEEEGEPLLDQLVLHKGEAAQEEAAREEAEEEEEDHHLHHPQHPRQRPQ